MLYGFHPIATDNNAFCELFSSSIGGARKEGFDIWNPAHRARMVAGEFDVIVLHWPTLFFRPHSRRIVLATLGQMARGRARGTRFVWVAHNLTPHDGGLMRSSLTATLFLALLSGIIHLSEHSRRELRKTYRIMPWTRQLVTVHGAYPRAQDAGTARRAPHGPPRLLTFGHVRPYKNLPALVRCAREAGVDLTVAGSVWDAGEGDAIREAAGDDTRIHLDLREGPIPDDELEAIIAAHDGIVLPYAQPSVLNSGVAMHALSRDRPVLVPRIGALPELAEAVPDWVHLFDPPITASHLVDFADAAAGLPKETRPDLTAYGWDRVGKDLSGFLEAIRRRNNRRNAP